MTRAGVHECAVLEIEDGVRERRHGRLRNLLDEQVERVEHARRGPCRRKGAHRATELAHGDGGLQPVTHDVADDERELAVAEAEGVVPVAADLQCLGPRPVRARDVRTLHGARRPSEETDLEGMRDVALVLVHERVVE
jgi:hypothetical protein